jgi:hypothetical protein
MKHISTALQHGPVQVDNDSSLLQRVLATDPDPKTACILALDMFLVGIDTVRHHIQGWCYGAVKGGGCHGPHTQASHQQKFTLVISVHIFLNNQNKKYMNNIYVTYKNTAFICKNAGSSFTCEVAAQDKKAC